MNGVVDLTEQYKLSENEHNEIYNIIEKLIFNNVKPVDNPTAIIVGAQPGSGKGSRRRDRDILGQRKEPCVYDRSGNGGFRGRNSRMRFDGYGEYC